MAGSAKRPEILKEQQRQFFNWPYCFYKYKKNHSQTDQATIELPVCVDWPNGIGIVKS